MVGARCRLVVCHLVGTEVVLLHAYIPANVVCTTDVCMRI